MAASAQLTRYFGLLALWAFQMFSSMATAGPEPISLFPTNIVAWESSGQAVVSVRGFNPNKEPAQLYFWTKPGTATEGLDFLPTSGTIACRPGFFQVECVVPIVDDCLSETAESFSLTFGESLGIPLSPFPVVQVTVMDNDRPGLIHDSFSAPSFIPEPNVMLVQPDGRILLGGAGLVRLLPDGSLDPEFNSPFAFWESYQSPGPDFRISALALLENGSILAGTRTHSGTNGIYNADLIRLSPTGKIDPQFQARIGRGSFYPGPYSSGQVITIAIQTDGKIVVGGDFVTPEQRWNLTRLKSDGKGDPSFNAGIGLWSESLLTPNSLGSVRQVLIQPDGKILACGEINRCDRAGCGGLTRLLPDGRLDTSFGWDPLSPGDLPYPGLKYVYSVALLPNGKILAGIDGVTRLLPSGLPDPAFHSGVQGTSTALILDPDGRIYVNGANRPGEPIDSWYGRLFRLHPEGALDTSLVMETFANREAKLHRERNGDLLVGPPAIRLRGEYPLSILSTDSHGSDMRVLIRAEAGKTYKLEASSDLKVWSTVDTKTAVTCPLELNDPSASGAPARFYRVLALP